MNYATHTPTVPPTAPLRYAAARRRRDTARRSARRSKVARHTVMLVLAGAILSAGLVPALLADGGAHAERTVTVRVQEGETLWEIAERVTPPHVSTAATVRTVRELNGLEGSLVQPGEVLEIPVEPDAFVAAR